MVVPTPKRIYETWVLRSLELSATLSSHERKWLSASDIATPEVTQGLLGEQH